jgi:hypothetical protein
MKLGIIREFKFFYDASFEIKILSCEVVIEYKGFFGRKKFFSGYYFGYLGGELKEGDEVYFEPRYGFFDKSSELKTLFKKNKYR